ncbi:MAG: DUF6596 domain-containing protein, partial [Pseudomonadota bacterium]
LVCAHPAIDASIRAPLMLQTLLGLNASEIASAFLVPAPTMGQRLVRAKAKIRDARIPFDLAEASTLEERLPSVLDAIYAAYTIADGAPADAQPDGKPRDLSAEAIWLARLATALMPKTGETQGLLALMLLSEARKAADRPTFVPLSQQEPALWDADAIADGEEALRVAAHLGQPGRYQIEAAILSAHLDRKRTGRTDWPGILRLYEALATIAPSIGATVAYAGALYEAGELDRARTVLGGLDPKAVAEYQPYWAVAAHVALALGDDATEAISRAIALAQRPDHAAYLARLPELLSQKQ